MSNTTNESRGVLQRLRNLLAADAERERTLPRALCRVCGGIVGQGLGKVEPEPVWRGPQRRSSALIDREREKLGLPIFHDWRRSHTACAGGPEETIRAITGLNVSPVVAAGALTKALPRRYTAFAAMPDPDFAHARFKDPKPRPWAHVDVADATALVSIVQSTHDSAKPRRCKSGACAWCGVSRSLSWHKSPERWDDGTDAPLCEDCFKVWRRRGASSDADDLRANALEALSGAAWFPMTGNGIRTYVDIADDDHTGTPGRWEYAPEPLAELRERTRIRHPRSLPAEIRDEYLAKASIAMREERAERQRLIEQAEADERQAANEAAAAAGWPVR